MVFSGAGNGSVACRNSKRITIPLTKISRCALPKPPMVPLPQLHQPSQLKIKELGPKAPCTTANNNVKKDLGLSRMLSQVKVPASH